MRVGLVSLSLFVALAATAFGQSADLGVEKLGPATAPPDSDVSYSLTVFNIGPDAAADVVFSDPIPAGMSLVTTTQESGLDFSCDLTIECTIASFPAGASATFTFVFHIDNGTEFLNTATVSSSTPDPNSENDQGVAFTAVTVPQADLSVTKSAPTAVAPDADVTFVVTLANLGPDAAANVLLTDDLPAPLIFVSFDQDSGPPMTCGTSTCTVATFPAGATATFLLTGHVPPGTPAGTVITNVAGVESDSDPNAENDTGTASVTVSSADVRVEKTGPATATAGTTITYEVTVTNDGPDDALDVSVDDPQLCATVDCSLGTLANGASVVLMGDVTIPPDATSWSNTAVVTTASFDPDLDNNTATVTTAVTPAPADVAITKTASSPAAPGGSNVTYTIVVTNEGPGVATGIVVTDDLPAEATFVSASPGCSGTTTVTCLVGTLAAGDSATIEIVVTLPTTPATIVNSASVASSSTDPEDGNDAATATIQVQPTVVAIPVLSPLALVLLALALSAVGLAALRRTG